jgi:hypothetical protein
MIRDGKIPRGRRLTVKIILWLAAMVLMRPDGVLFSGLSTNYSVWTWAAHGSVPRHLIIAGLLVTIADRYTLLAGLGILATECSRGAVGACAKFYPKTHASIRVTRRGITCDVQRSAPALLGHEAPRVYPTSAMEGLSGLLRG